MVVAGRRVIFTTFAGRQHCMSLLLKYVRYLIKCGIVDEFHAWNFTRNAADEIWLSQEMRQETWRALGTFEGYTFHQLKNVSLDKNDDVTLRFRAPHDAHLLLNDDRGDVLEIAMGGWDNTKIAFRSFRQGHILHVIESGVTGDWTDVYVRSTDAGIYVSIEGKDAVTIPVRGHGRLYVSIASWDKTRAEWEIRPPSKEKLMQVSNKRSWGEYYKFYTKEKFSNSIIVKCDDDIVFVDPGGAYRFLQQVATNMGDHLLAFPSIVNNAVCAYHWQQAGLLPEDVFGVLPYDNFEGRLWGDGRLCQAVHEYFVSKRAELVDAALDLPSIRVPQGHRVSINFFAVRSEDLPVTFGLCGDDDEQDLTVTLTKKNDRHNMIVQSAIVSHLGFYRQRETGLDERRCIKLYEDVATASIK